MMTLLSAVLSSLAGPLFRWVTIPAIVLAALTFGKVAWEKREARILAAGEQVCDAKWRADVRRQEAEAANARAATLEDRLNLERQVSEDLQNELATIKTESEALRARAAGAADGRCLSDAVLDTLKSRDSQPAPGPARRHRKK